MMVEVDPTIKVLSDTIKTIPESCFINDPHQQRQALINSIKKVAQFIKSFDNSGALSVIESEILFTINSGLLEECDQLIPTKTIKEQLITYRWSLCIPAEHFPLFLKECEWRFNNSDPTSQLAQLRQWVKQYMG